MRSLSFALAAMPVAGELMLGQGPNPIQRVIKLLNQMKSELDEERKADEKLYEDLQCWCKTNKKDKEAAIAENKNKAKNLEAEINKYAGSSGEYKAAMQIAEEAVKKAEKKLEDETASHEETVKGLRNDETDLTGTVNALENAIQVLGKHQGLIQKKPALIQSVSSVIHFASQKARIMHGAKQSLSASFLQSTKGLDASFSKALDDTFEPLLNFDESARTLEQFIQTSHKGKQPSHLGTYESQSGGVFGILTQMKEDFVADLADTKNQIKEETEGFKKMKGSLQTELKTQNKAFDDAKANFGKAEFYSTEGKEELQKTRDTFAADTKVLSAVKSKCQSIDKDWALRTEARTAEIEAVDQALGIMTSDESREALGFAFLQTSSRTTVSKSEKNARKAASDVLKMAADGLTNSWGAFSASDITILNRQKLLKQKQNLMLAAQSVRIDAFTKVKEIIDKMVADIKQQMADDVKSKDQCGTDIKANEQSTRDATRLKSVTESNIEGLTAEIEQIGKEIVAAEENIATQKKAIKKASEEREEENANFQANVKEQRAMHGVLQKAYTVLKTHYDKASLLQVASHQTPMPGEFTPYKKNDGSNAVLTMFEKIMADTKTEEAEALKAESESQAEYQTFVADTNQAIEDLASEIATMGEKKAMKAKNLSEEKTTLKDTDAEIANLGQVNGALHQQCDFLIKYFDVRQEAMSKEIAACQKAKAILSGAK